MGDTEPPACSGGIRCADLVESVEHHPPDIVIVALVHFVFVFAVVALLVYVGLVPAPGDRRLLHDRD